jgi:hypothetical protein
MRFLVPLLVLFTNVSAFKVLIYNPKITKSMVGHMNKIGDILNVTGHDVVSISMKYVTKH